MTKRVSELRKLSEEDLKKRLEELKADLLKRKAEARMGTIKNTSSIRNIRKDIARIYTILSEKKRNEKK
ncbi:MULTISPECIES: 50S ribosomal protein L29 [Metallosphaera]|uniref:Large ribosomal subunit protein uL29 n=3 Tax=Metallosphaera TaxID=41980 RepID=A4YCX3_METS5|nr:MULTISPECIES: 50S ribosomal protein L29 [Metallosphaera]ABP94275.1 LSU ribosomal protein L29P [Metallosphaera sedula DSM 5348]AIM26262.1 LSU ribosomal protein L29P [Metallosphaera sedula]AKV73277.1 50S ribosomal protein L29 [Metallosphaera sedula]AKV75521.1 50S ribosomal protein L29 [Metallosphaera sedula]AKV77767.1 50S ribosomal protein L29 [Metallosphaera sedula]